MKSSHWFVRVDEGSPERAAKLLELLQLYNSTLCVREQPDKDSPNPHYHFTLKSEKPIGKDAFNARIKKVITDLSGNKDFSTREWVQDEAQTTDMYNYMCKGDEPGYTPKNPDVVYNTNIDVEKHHNQYWQKNKEIKKGKDRENPFSTDSIIAKTIAEIKLNLDVYCTTSKKVIVDESTLFTCVVSYMLHACHGKLQPNQAYSITSAVMYHFKPNWVYRNLEASLRDRFFCKLS